MLVRIVKMTFDASKIEEFLENFNKNKQKIRNSNGCRLLELYRDKNNSAIFFSYSYWECEEDLNTYRNSDLFKNVWAKTKVLFAEKPEAWSVDKLEIVSSENEV
ncbi:antibiotic biosynthesis monooxygenase [Lutibacter sp. TH_r2]|uniref:putative quinol monooxygenase n=1 Tax=Lutibacter sp. TH_r2 TaxID=3082083 RepID=UPI002952BBDB|nr:antibiotic biosynthesis monooxygenase [Lutibacter sp. TH_r2]MDV7187270.1 antibiotic biosynthesis monooxygenase [Lutibacter sp. TH_r2]